MEIQPMDNGAWQLETKLRGPTGFPGLYGESDGWAFLTCGTERMFSGSVGES